MTINVRNVPRAERLAELWEQLPIREALALWMEETAELIEGLKSFDVEQLDALRDQYHELRDDHNPLTRYNAMRPLVRRMLDTGLTLVQASRFIGVPASELVSALTQRLPEGVTLDEYTARLIACETIVDSGTSESISSLSRQVGLGRPVVTEIVRRRCAWSVVRPERMLAA